MTTSHMTNFRQSLKPLIIPTDESEKYYPLWPNHLVAANRRFRFPFVALVPIPRLSPRLPGRSQRRWLTETVTVLRIYAQSDPSTAS